ncbi:MAG: type I 3-dehydroquinate dehydratase, partial [candidate division WOR-3 bacterium]
AKLLNGLDARKIVTLRPSWEGGHYEGDEKRRLELIGRVAAWADFVDLERDIVDSNPALVDELRGMGVRVISSRHFVGGSPIGSELRRIVSEGLKAVDIVKVVNSPGALSEAVEMLALYSEASFRDRLVSFSMGERWCLTRVFSVLLGAPFTYASLPGQPVAPGQLSFPEVVKALEVLSKTWHS